MGVIALASAWTKQPPGPQMVKPQFAGDTWYPTQTPFILPSGISVVRSGTDVGWWNNASAAKLYVPAAKNYALRDGFLLLFVAANLGAASTVLGNGVSSSAARNVYMQTTYARLVYSTGQNDFFATNDLATKAGYVFHVLPNGEIRYFRDGKQQDTTGTVTSLATAEFDISTLAHGSYYNISTGETYLVHAMRGQVPVEVARDLSRNPWQIFEPVRRRLPFSTQGPAAALAGSAAAAAVSGGVLTAQVKLSAAALAQVAASGALSAGVKLSGQAVTVSLANGVLTTKVSLSGALSAAASASGILTAPAGNVYTLQEIADAVWAKVLP